MRHCARAAACLAVVVAVALLWPQRWGGVLTYDITRGTSMEPRFHSGDLAVVRSTHRYRVGDIAAYRSSSLHTTVLHRIVAVTPEGYTFKGDNNAFDDPDPVTARDLVGTLALRVPSVGSGLSWLVQPSHLVVGVVGFGLLLSDRERRPGSRRRGGTVAPPRPPSPVVVVAGLRLPDGLALVDVATASELRELAAGYALPLLRTRTAHYVVHGATVFRHRPATTPVPRPRRAGGRAGAPASRPAVRRSTTGAAVTEGARADGLTPPRSPATRTDSPTG